MTPTTDQELETTMHVYKGVAPGTHYASRDRDPRSHGFAGDPAQAAEVDDVVRHITAHSFPSTWVSVTMSFAVAADYATVGGKVYEIILTRVGPSDIADPVAMLARYADAAHGRFVHHHDGHQTLTASLALPGAGAGGLAVVPLRAGAPPRRRGPPAMVSRLFLALVFATRDAELLLAAVPARAVGNVYVIPGGEEGLP